MKDFETKWPKRINIRSKTHYNMEECAKSKKYRYQSIKQKEQSKLKNPKDKTITWNKETQMTGQHEPLWNLELKSGAQEG